MTAVDCVTAGPRTAVSRRLAPLIGQEARRLARHPVLWLAPVIVVAAISVETPSTGRTAGYWYDTIFVAVTFFAPLIVLFAANLVASILVGATCALLAAMRDPAARWRSPDHHPSRSGRSPASPHDRPIRELRHRPGRATASDSSALAWPDDGGDGSPGSSSSTNHSRRCANDTGKRIGTYL